MMRPVLLSLNNNTLRYSSSSSRHYYYQRRFSSADDFDVLIVGGGVVGGALANCLQHLPSSLSIGLIEAENKMVPAKNTITLPDIPHPRSYALSPSSLQILDIDALTTGQTYGGCYDSMQVWEAQQPASLVFHSSDIINIGTKTNYLGCCIEDSVLRDHLYKHKLKPQQQQQQQTIEVMEGSKLTHLQRTGGWMHGIITTASAGTDADPLQQRRVRTQLLVAADGANSHLRTTVGIGTKSIHYGQTALTFTVEIAGGSTKQRAYQRFLESGLPLALLPTRSEKHMVIVWSLSNADALYWKDSPKLLEQLNDQLQTGPQTLEFPEHGNSLLLGFEKVLETIQYGLARPVDFCAPPLLTEIVSPVYSFPLSSQMADAFTKDSYFALVGDAAHTMHPLAGQGLNLGLQDVQDLSRCIERAVRAGLPVGTFLKDYETSRNSQVKKTLAGIHAIQRVFQQSHHLSKNLKSFGMSMIQNIAPIRRQVVQAACHGVAL